MSSSRQSARESLKRLRPYVAGKGFTEISRRYGLDPADIVKLGSNENPYGPSPKVFEALQNVSPERYPEPEELMEGLARYTGSPEEMGSLYYYIGTRSLTDIMEELKDNRE